MDPTVFADIPLILTDFPTGQNDSGIIAHSPTIRVPGMMHRRIVLRHIGNSYVVHCQAWDKVGEGEPCEFHHGDYFNYGGHHTLSELEAFKQANKQFRKRMKALLNEIQ